MADTTTPSTSGFKQDIARVGQGVDTLRDDMGRVASIAADAARSGAAEMKSGARHAIDAAKDQFEHAKEGASDAVHSVTGVIKRHPIATVAVVAGVGLVLGMFLSRSRN